MFANQDIVPDQDFQSLDFPQLSFKDFPDYTLLSAEKQQQKFDYFSQQQVVLEQQLQQRQQEQEQEKFYPEQFLHPGSDATAATTTAEITPTLAMYDMNMINLPIAPPSTPLTPEDGEAMLSDLQEILQGIDPEKDFIISDENVAVASSSFTTNTSSKKIDGYSDTSSDFGGRRFSFSSKSKSKRIRKRKTVHQIRQENENKVKGLLEEKEKLSSALKDCHQEMRDLFPYIRLLLSKKGLDV